MMYDGEQFQTMLFVEPISLNGKDIIYAICAMKSLIDLQSYSGDMLYVQVSSTMLQ